VTTFNDLSLHWWDGHTEWPVTSLLGCPHWMTLACNQDMK